MAPSDHGHQICHHQTMAIRSVTIRPWPSDLSPSDHGHQICYHRTMAIRSVTIRPWPSDLSPSDHGQRICHGIPLPCRTTHHTWRPKPAGAIRILSPSTGQRHTGGIAPRPYPHAPHLAIPIVGCQPSALRQTRVASPLTLTLFALLTRILHLMRGMKRVWTDGRGRGCPYAPGAPP